MSRMSTELDVDREAPSASPPSDDASRRRRKPIGVPGRQDFVFRDGGRCRSYWIGEMRFYQQSGGGTIAALIRQV